MNLFVNNVEIDGVISAEFPPVQEVLSNIRSKMAEACMIPSGFRFETFTSTDEALLLQKSFHNMGRAFDITLQPQKVFAQVKFPRSKRKRIRKKWRKNPKYWGWVTPRYKTFHFPRVAISRDNT